MKEQQNMRGNMRDKLKEMLGKVRGKTSHLPGGSASKAGKAIREKMNGERFKKLKPKMKKSKSGEDNIMRKLRKMQPLEKGNSGRKLKDIPLQMPIRGGMPAKQPEWMKPDYKPGSRKRGYTKYAQKDSSNKA